MTLCMTSILPPNNWFILAMSNCQWLGEYTKLAYTSPDSEIPPIMSSPLRVDRGSFPKYSIEASSLCTMLSIRFLMLLSLKKTP